MVPLPPLRGGGRCSCFVLDEAGRLSDAFGWASCAWWRGRFQAGLAMADGGELPAVRSGGRKKYVRFSDEIGVAICARVEAGESLSRVCRGPEMPHATSV